LCVQPRSKQFKIELSATAFRGNLCALMQQVNLGMIGGGTVGSGVFHALQHNGGLMAARLGVKLAFRADPNYHVENFKIINANTNEEYR